MTQRYVYIVVVVHSWDDKEMRSLSQQKKGGLRMFITIAIDDESLLLLENDAVM